jgi:rare lipoprotein A
LGARHRYIVASASGILPSGIPISATASAAATAGDRYLQAGAFSDLRAAQRLSDRLRDLTSRPVFIRSIQAADTSQQLHRVRVGPISDPSEIERISDLMQSANLGHPYVVEE